MIVEVSIRRGGTAVSQSRRWSLPAALSAMESLRFSLQGGGGLRRLLRKYSTGARVLDLATAVLYRVTVHGRRRPAPPRSRPPRRPARPGARAARGIGTTTFSIEVNQEDAQATYTADMLAFTASGASSATVMLRATVLDSADTAPGDIRNATVTFINRGTNTAISGCANLPVGLVNPGNLQTGTATCNWSVAISGDSQDFTIGIAVNNYYTRSTSADDAVVMVAKPLASNFISGGGYIVLSNSAGLKAGDVGSKNNFGFSVKYNKSGTNLQGNPTSPARSEGSRILILFFITVRRSLSWLPAFPDRPGRDYEAWREENKKGQEMSPDPFCVHR